MESTIHCLLHVDISIYSGVDFSCYWKLFAPRYIAFLLSKVKPRFFHLATSEIFKIIDNRFIIFMIAVRLNCFFTNHHPFRRCSNYTSSPPDFYFISKITCRGITNIIRSTDVINYATIYPNSIRYIGDRLLKNLLSIEIWIINRKRCNLAVVRHHNFQVISMWSDWW